MAVVHNTSMKPGKLELLTAWLPQQSWYLGSGRAPELVRAGGFRLDDPEGEVGIEFLVVVDTAGPDPVAYLVPMSYRGAPNGTGPGSGLIGISEHGVLGTRWIYDGTADPVLMTELAALLGGRAVPQKQSESDAPDPTVTVYPVTAGDAFSYEVLHVLRPLEEPASELPGEAGTGQVVAGWVRPDGTAARAVFATAVP
ncbi:maltokinase N-terminal cap-like domain-containing protein [Kitasatospora sp. P5_F3]